VALRQEWFNDVDVARTATVDGVTLFSTTATLQYNTFGCSGAGRCLRGAVQRLSTASHRVAQLVDFRMRRRWHLACFFTRA
jgi:hypothetical protein